MLTVKIELKKKRIMSGRTTSVKLVKRASNIFISLIIIIFFLSFAFLPSCRSDEDGNQYAEGSSGNSGLYLFDYEKIKIENTSSIDLRISGSNLYLDIYQDLIVLGEIENISAENKTDIEITLDFYDKYGNRIISANIPAAVNYLRGGSTLPFWYYVTERENYINISRLKIGVNYKDHYESFKGNPIVESESYSYTGDYLIIEGRVINLGKGRIRNLKLFCTFYNDRDQVVFINQCYLPAEEMSGGEGQGFVLKVLLDEYLPEFTHYDFGIFFEDDIEMPV
jgi:hypothetical protein